jgi:8-oxo-dGTP pyrophosphatase MutT (NUDIX family)
VPIRWAVGGFQRVRRAVWFVTRPPAFGAHAVALTPDGEVIFVRHTYKAGWRRPGGGLKPGESARDAVLRELREEIGLSRHGAVEHVGEFRHRPDFRDGLAQVFRVRDVAFDPPAWSLEIEEVRAFAPASLPPDLPRITARQLRMAGLLPPAADDGPERPPGGA